MSSEIKAYLLSVVATAMMLSFGQALVPKGSVQKLVSFAGGLLIIFAVLTPIVDIDYDAIARSMENFSVVEGAAPTFSSAQNRDWMEDIIKEECRAYILDKAEELGAEVNVEINLDEQTACPVEVVLVGKTTAEQRIHLSEYIYRTMDIPVQRQEWRLD